MVRSPLRAAWPLRQSLLPWPVITSRGPSPDGSFCGAGIESLRLPPDFHFTGPKACENCKRLTEVDLMCTDITAIWSSTFAYCVALVDIWLPPKVQRIGKEAFLCCASLRELVIPPKLRYLGIRAFCGCEQLSLFTQLDAADSDRGVQAEDNTFLMCDNFEREAWIELPSTKSSTKGFTNRVPLFISDGLTLGECLSTRPGQRSFQPVTLMLTVSVYSC